MPTPIDSTIENVIGTAKARLGEARTRFDEVRDRLDHEARAGVERYGVPVIELARSTADKVTARVPEVTEAVNDLAPRVKTFVHDMTARFVPASVPSSDVATNGATAPAEAAAETTGS
jgi:hypothetical protein